MTPEERLYRAMFGRDYKATAREIGPRNSAERVGQSFGEAVGLLAPLPFANDPRVIQAREDAIKSGMNPETWSEAMRQTIAAREGV